MTVSHLVVSWIQVGGLAISLYGLFYLSLGLFPRTGISLFRPLLPAGGAGILGYVFGAVREHFPKEVIFILPFSAYVFGLISFVIGYLVAFQAQFLKEETSNRIQIVLRASLTGVGAIITICVATAVALSVQFVGDAATTAIADITINSIQLLLVLLFVIGLSIPIFLTPGLTEKRLQMTGFAFSVLGIFTGFLPAILDVANIAVR